MCVGPVFMVHKQNLDPVSFKQGNTFPEKVTVPLDESGESSADRTDQHARHNDVMWTAVIVTF